MMKITKVEVVVPKSVSGTFVGCRIYTDEGIYGDGEASLKTGVGLEAGAAMIASMAPFVIGMNPLHSEGIWDSLLRLQSIFWGQNGGPVVYGAMSAIDIALWDIKGKYFKTPVYNLLGGKKRQYMRTYASQPQFGWGNKFEYAGTPEALAENVVKIMESGYDATKIDFLWGTPEFALKGMLPSGFWNKVEKKVEAVRKAVGSDFDIIIENHGTTDTLSALQMLKMVEPYDIYYLEEPTIPDAKQTKYISERTDIPIASGERIQTRWQYKPYFESNALSIIQPDVGTCGGITEAKRICDMAYVYEMGVQMHNCHGPISQAATLHLETSISNFVIHEDCTRGGKMQRPLPNGASLSTRSFEIQDGKIQAPAEPGLGTEWSPEVMQSSITATITEPADTSRMGLVKTLDASFYGK